MSVFITGPAGSGKTSELLRRAREAAANGPIALITTAPWNVERLRAALNAPGARVCALQDLALDLIAGAEIVDDVRAAELFEESAQPLFSLSWVEFLETDLDFEIPGLRAPQRFAEAAFRLFRKLRDALITPEAFLESALRGATQFYAKPPNLAGADLLHYTKDTYRDSLDADAAELNRQYKHEIDLARILSRLYRAYLDHPVRAGCLTARDAVAYALERLAKDDAPARELRASLPLAFVDDAQEMTVGEVTFLQAVYGEKLDGVTLTYDRDSVTSAFRGARPDRVFAIEGERVALETQHRSPYAIEVAARHLLAVPGAPPLSGDVRVGLQLFRATTQAAEAQFAADYVVDLLQGGVPQDEIALIFRNVDSVHVYRDALLARNVPVQVCGDVNLFGDAAAQDALAVLWTVYDPYRHDYLLRVLQGGVLNLSDATVQTLCSEPRDTQTVLFNDVPGAEETRSGRWDAKRDVRLGLNVLRGDRDSDLPSVARERLEQFRAIREQWLAYLRNAPLDAAVRRIWREGLAADQPVVRAAYQQQTLERIERRVCEFAQRHPDASLGEFLEYAEGRMHSSFEGSEFQERSGSVRMLSIDAARGRTFDYVLLPNVRAGSFPRWYVPDSFLYSPSLGMIAKENVGEAASSRTAKFTYYMWRTKAREAYNQEERRAFVYALRRARVSAVVTASGRATRGVSAPEFLAELQAARLPGVQDLSDRWRPAKTLYNA